MKIQCKVFALIVLVTLEFTSAIDGWKYGATDCCCGDYQNRCGENYWSYLVGCESCDGTSQSPIDIKNHSSVFTQTNPLQITNSLVGCKTWEQFSSNSSFEVDFINDFEEYCNFNLTFRGIHYTLHQLHFHSPSEHLLFGQQSDAEVHLVHRTQSKVENSVLVIGIRFEVDASVQNNSLLNSLWIQGTDNIIHGLPVHVDSSYVAINPYDELIPQTNQAYYNYNGSFTTPPCSEIVEWVVFEEILIISTFDLHMIRKASMALSTNNLNANGDSNRGVQNLFSREIIRYSTSSFISVNSNKAITKNSGGINLFALTIAIAVIVGTIILGMTAFRVYIIHKRHFNSSNEENV
eukprot:gene5530-7646_t